MTVPLGRDGLTVSRQGLGCMGMGHSYGRADDRESVATIRRAVELGVTLLDTADLYGSSTGDPGSNETLVGQAIHHIRDQVVLATKVGFVYADGERRLCGRPEYVRAACDASLRRLGTDRIDLYHLHRVDPAVPVEDSVGALAELVAAGKVLHIGLSMVDADQLRAAHAVHPVSAVQSEYSLWRRDIEHSVLPAARALGVGLVPYSPLGRGFLAGAVAAGDDVGRFRSTLPRFGPAALAANAHIADTVRDVAEELGATAAQVALAWVHSRGADVVPIPGTRHRRHLTANVGALDLTLSPAQLDRLDRLHRTVTE
ncbi:aldo/keto reductase [Actinocatenispora rupis]|uniref:Oxidoreductase n=1 Tax=Actinocatenispora rupis TaxID=519421 RepID=A0A8J3J0T3_9ACTN|nr:aldo/keto reductase [Actinocatenispora rupis]GID09827.1 oxidoreductase [Actinocatenispora rupis]